MKVVILVLLACAAVASALVYWQRKRHENYSLLSGLDSRYGTKEDEEGRLSLAWWHFLVWDQRIH